jgi:transposase
VKDEVLIRATSGAIEILKDNKRIASHQRIKPDKKYCYNTLPEHMPEKHRFKVEWTPERLIKWAEKIGPDTMAYVGKIMQSRQHPEQGFRACLGILNLSNSYNESALERACTQALEYRKYSYKALKIIIDNLPANPPDTEQPIPVHSNVRGREYFQQIVNGGEG